MGGKIGRREWTSKWLGARARHRPGPGRTSQTRSITRVFLYGQSYKEDMVCERGKSSRERRFESDGMELGLGVDLQRAP